MKSSLKLSGMSYIGRIHKITSIGKRTKWKLHLVSILKQIHLKIGQEAKKIYKISNLSRNLKNLSWLPSSIDLEVQILMI
jgi:hypothetical protein